MECVGCGAIAELHPFVGIGRLTQETGFWRRLTGSVAPAAIQAYPVCEACWHFPEHRMRQLKLHFFPEALAMQGLIGARISEEKSKRGEDLSL